MKAMSAMTLGKKLERFAETYKMTAIARRAGISHTAMSKYARHGVTPSAPTALKIARVLGVSVEWLIDDEQGWPPVYEQRATSSTPPPDSDAA